MSAFDRMSVSEIAEAVPDGALLGVPADYSGVPMAFTRALIARGARKSRRRFAGSLEPYCLIEAELAVGEAQLRGAAAVGDHPHLGVVQVEAGDGTPPGPRAWPASPCRRSRRPGPAAWGGRGR